MDNFNNEQNRYNQFGQYDQYDQYNAYTQNNGNYSGVSSALTGDNYKPTYDKQLGGKKSNKKKIFLIGALVVIIAVIAIGVFSLINMFTESFEVNDFDKVNGACRDVFNNELTVVELNGHYGTVEDNYVVLRTGMMNGAIKGVSYRVTWVEFDNATSANTYMKVFEEKLEETHEELDDEIGNSNSFSTNNKITWSYEYEGKDDLVGRIFFAKTDNCVVEIELTGEETKVDYLYKKFKRKIK